MQNHKKPDMSENSRNTEELNVARKRLQYRAWHRGTKELDFILGHFMDAHIQTFDAKTIADFESLLNCEETELQQWLMGQKPVPEGKEGKMLSRIRAFHLQTLSHKGAN